MMKIKVFLSWLLCLCLFAVCGCEKAELPDESGKIRVLCTVFPTYDWLRNVTADAETVELTLLDTHGADLHSYQPTVSDMACLAESDFVIYVGGESDRWVAEAVKNSGTDVIGVSLLELLDDRVKAEEITEGMQEYENDSHREEVPDSDEHVWLSVKNAIFFTQCLTEILCEADAEQAEVLQQASDAYVEQLTALEQAFSTAVKDARLSTFVVCDRFPFRYLADDYALKYYAAFPGCSAETDAGFDTVIFLAGKIDELRLSHIAVTESADRAVAQAVLENVHTKDVSIVTLDSLQSVSQDAAAGKSYLSAMRKNLAALQQLLS